MRVGLGIPYWGDDPLRALNHHITYDILEGLFPWDMFLSHKVEGRGAARNELVRNAASMKCDVVVLCDADSYPEKETLRSAILGAYTDGGLHFAYDRWRLVSNDTEQVIAEGPGSLGGCMAVRPQDWWDAGGSPELPAWGFEDVMFAVQSRTLIRPNSWHPGELTCLWHPTECVPGSPSYNRQIALCKQVEALDGDRAEILKWIALHPDIYPGRQ